MFASDLKVRHIRDGKVIKEVDAGSGTVTLAGAILMAADAANATATLKAMSFHDSGTGTSSADLGQIALQIPLTASQVGGRASATISSILNVYTNVATIQYNVGAVVGEWGLFNASTAGTMWDRKVLFPTFTVLANDQLQFIYVLTIIPGG